MTEAQQAERIKAWLWSNFGLQDRWQEQQDGQKTRVEFSRVTLTFWIAQTQESRNMSPPTCGQPYADGAIGTRSATHLGSEKTY